MLSDGVCQVNSVTRNAYERCKCTRCLAEGKKPELNVAMVKREHCTEPRHLILD
jgi:hypothetical protein